MVRVRRLPILASLGMLLCAVVCWAAEVAQPTAAPKEGQLTLTVPRGDEPVLRLPPGHLVGPGSLRIAGKSGEFQVTEEAKPAKGQYRVLQDGSLLLSVADAKQKISVRYRYVPARVATLPVVNQTDLDYVAPTTRAAVDKALGAMGFESIGDAEVAAAMRAQGISFDAVTTGIGEPPTADEIARFAQSLGASHALLAVVGNGVRRNDGGYIAIGNILVPADERPALGLTLAMYDGGTGKVLFSKSKAGSKSEGLGSRRAARIRLAENLIRDLLYERFGYKLD